MSHQHSVAASEFIDLNLFSRSAGFLLHPIQPNLPQRTLSIQPFLAFRFFRSTPDQQLGSVLC